MNHFKQLNNLTNVLTFLRQETDGIYASFALYHIYLFHNIRCNPTKINWQYLNFQYFVILTFFISFYFMKYLQCISIGPMSPCIHVHCASAFLYCTMSTMMQWLYFSFKNVIQCLRIVLFLCVFVWAHKEVTDL